MAQTTTARGRLQIETPDKGFDTLDGGTALFNALTAIWTALSDNIGARWTGDLTIGISANSDVIHNFNLAITQLKILVFESGSLLTNAQTIASYTITQTDVNTINVANISGVSKTIQVVILPYKLSVQGDDFDPAVALDTTGNVKAAELRTSGDDMVINHGASGAGADWVSTVRRPSSGMTGDAVHTLPLTTGTLVSEAVQATLTNKDYDGGTASDNSRMTLPKNSNTNLDGLTRKEATVAYDEDANAPVVDNGTILKQLAAGAAKIEDASSWDGATSTHTYDVSAYTDDARGMIWALKDNGNDWADMGGEIDHPTATQVRVTFGVDIDSGTYTLVGR